MDIKKILEIVKEVTEVIGKIAETIEDNKQKKESQQKSNLINK